jgi:hypothetical protein
MSRWWSPEKRSHHVARKEHNCLWGDVITPGEVYTDEAWPPWTHVQDDPDSRGGPMGFWVHNRSHADGRHY